MGGGGGGVGGGCGCVFFFFNDTATTEIYTLSLHDALPILLVLDKAIGLDCCVFRRLRRATYCRFWSPAKFFEIVFEGRKKYFTHVSKHSPKHFA